MIDALFSLVDPVLVADSQSKAKWFWLTITMWVCPPMGCAQDGNLAEDDDRPWEFRGALFSGKSTCCCSHSLLTSPFLSEWWSNELWKMCLLIVGNSSNFRNRKQQRCEPQTTNIILTRHVAFADDIALFAEDYLKLIVWFLNQNCWCLNPTYFNFCLTHMFWWLNHKNNSSWPYSCHHLIRKLQSEFGW